MKKAVLIISLLASLCAQAEEKYQNQINVGWGNSFRSDGVESDFHIANISYSQPNTFFRQDGRRNLHLSQYKGTNGDGVEEEISLFGLSQDVFLGTLNGYLVVGLGAFISSDGTDRIGSKFVFRERVGLGAYYGPFNLEAYAMHYSNGTLQTPNKGENFAVVSLGYRY